MDQPKLDCLEQFLASPMPLLTHSWVIFQQNQNTLGVEKTLYFCWIYSWYLFSALWMMLSKVELPLLYFLIGSIIFYATYYMGDSLGCLRLCVFTPDYHERTRVMGYSNFVGQVAYLLTPWFYWFMGGFLWWNHEGCCLACHCYACVVAVCGVLSAIF